MKVKLYVEGLNAVKRHSDYAQMIASLISGHMK